MLSVRFSSRHSLLLQTSPSASEIRKFLSVRFSSRHSLLPSDRAFIVDPYVPFSPLFIAAFTATYVRRVFPDRQPAFSPLFIAAFTATPIPKAVSNFKKSTFSPLFIAAFTATESNGSFVGVARLLSVRFSSRHSLLPDELEVRRGGDGAFSPLFIAAFTATDLSINSRNSSKPRNHLRLYVLLVIFPHRRRPVNFKRHRRREFSVHR